MSTKIQIKPMVYPISVDHFKKSAKRLIDILKSRNIELKHSEALEMMSNIDGYKDYNTFVAMAKKNNEESNAQYARLTDIVEGLKNTLDSNEKKLDLINTFHVNDISEQITDLEKTLFFYEDNNGNYLDIRRAVHDIVDFNISKRVEDFIIVTLRNEYLPIRRAKINIFDKNSHLLDYEDLLKNILKEFKEVSFKSNVKKSVVPVKINGKISKNFQIKELLISHEQTIKINDVPQMQVLSFSNRQSFPSTAKKNLSFSIKCHEKEYGTSIDLIIKLDDKILIDETVGYGKENIINVDEAVLFIDDLPYNERFKNTLFIQDKNDIIKAFDVKLDGEKLYSHVYDELDIFSGFNRTYIIKIVENAINKNGLYNAMLEEIKSFMQNPNDDYLSALSSAKIKELIVTEQSTNKEFTLEKELTCFDFNKLIDEV